MFKRIALILVLSAAFLTPLASAQELVLKSGQKVQGKIVEQNDKFIKFDSDLGTTITFYLDEIDTIDGQKVEAKTPEAIPTPSAIPVDNVPTPVATREVLKSPEPVQPLVNVLQDSQTPPAPQVPQEPQIEHQVESPTPTPIPVTPVAAEEPKVIQNNPAPAQNSVDTYKPSRRVGHAISTRSAAIAALGVGGMLVILVIVLGLLIFSSYCLYLISKKTNRGTAWMAWVPIASMFLMCKIAGVRYTWLFLLFVGIIPILGSLVLCGLFGFIWYKIALVRNKPGWLGILTVVPLVGLIIYGYLAFSD